MFPSSNMVINTSTIEINQQPVSYPHHDQPSFFINRPNFHNDLSSTPNPNSNSKQENPPPHHPPLCCFDFPSPFGNDDVLVLPQQQHHDLQSLEHSQVPGSLMREAAADGHQHQHQQSSTTTSTTTNTLIKMVDWESNKLNHDKNIDEGEQHQIPMRSSRRPCKRDRHSKIKTARGMRDRRMRLSLEIARRFFGLQDVLGFDKASKTVEWLLKQAEPEIKKLLKLQGAGTTRDGLEILNYYHNSKSTSSATSESCEMVSGIDEVATNIIDVKETKRNSKRKRSAFHHPLAKALREKARARARERTREKMRRRERSSFLVVVDDHDHEDQSKQHQQQPPCDQLSRLSSWSTSPPFEAGEESANNNNINHDPIPNSLQLLQAEVLEQPISSSHLAAAGGTSTSTAATAHQDLHLVDHNAHDANLVITGRYWSPSPSFNSLQQTSCTGISQEQHHLFADIQLFGKPWEAYNTHNLF